MFVSDRLVYLQMQKTGSSHVTRVLRKFTRGAQTIKHEQMTNYDQYKDRLIVSSVRNPWDWYVSLWAFGCSGSGGFRKYLEQLPMSEIRNALRNRDTAGTVRSLVRAIIPAGRRPDWERLYSDATSEANFREWLKLVLGAEGQFISKEGYSASPIKSTVGYMTYRFLALTTEYGPWTRIGRAARSYGNVESFADQSSIARRIMRMETLNSDLLNLLHSVDVDVTMEKIDAIGKTNTSSHRKYTDYYDDETYRLVAERDRLIIERFDYRLF